MATAAQGLYVSLPCI